MITANCTFGSRFPNTKTSASAKFFGIFGLNFERLQGLDESSHLQSLFFKFGYLRENNTDIAFNFDPLTNNTANLSYLKHYNYFDLKLDTNYSFTDENPDYGLNLQLSNTF